MLDRMGGNAGDALRVLADASEALGIEGRRDARNTPAWFRLNRFVDAVPPESPVVRHLDAVGGEGCLQSSGARAEIADLRAAFTDWSANDCVKCPTTS